MHVPRHRRAAYDLRSTRDGGRTGSIDVATSRGRAEREERRRAQAYAVRQAVHAERGERRRRDDRLAVGSFALVVGLAIAAQAAWFTIGPGAAATAVAPMPTPTSSASGSATPTPAPTP